MTTQVLLLFVYLAIEKDAFDPHFLASVQKLGPVRVDHHMRTVRPVSYYLLLNISDTI
jgi:hypothetical protein